MTFRISEFLEHPGVRRPIRQRLDDAAWPSGEEDGAFRESITVTGEGFAQMGTLYLDVEIRTLVERRCGRCLIPVQTRVAQHETFSLELPPSGESIDLEGPIVGAILSALDPHPLCRRDCRGLCPHCGANLNEEPDHVCSQAREDRRRLGDFLQWKKE
jgi:uncharacterized metal-binding protein YceD (DUF177 family)